MLRTNEIGTIARWELMRKNGSVQKYCQVKLDKCPEEDTWFMEDQIGKITEDVNVTLCAENGDKMYMNFTKNHEKKQFTVEINAGGKPLIDFRQTAVGEVLGMIADCFYRDGMITKVEV